MDKIIAPSIVYIKGEEMTRYAMEIILNDLIKPYIDTSNWEFYDLSAKYRDNTQDQVLQDVVDAGLRIRTIFKEPTITPTEDQKEILGIKKAWGSPNGVIRRGWNGVTISRDTIMVEGVELGYKRPVFFERQAVGGEYGANFAKVGAGRIETVFYPKDGGAGQVISENEIVDQQNMVVTYHNPLDNTVQLARHFFQRCLDADITPYVVTKKTVFKWQEEFWQIHKQVFDNEFKDKFLAKNLLDDCHGHLEHIISDAAEMKIPKWTDGGFGMSAHNYDGDMLTDLLAIIHRSAGFISSSLIGATDDGQEIAEFEASHGTVSDMNKRRLAGQETSLNPLGLIFALKEAMNHSARRENNDQSDKILHFTGILWQSIENVIKSGHGTRDVAGVNGSTTEQYIALVAEELKR